MWGLSIGPRRYAKRKKVIMVGEVAVKTVKPVTVLKVFLLIWVS